MQKFKHILGIQKMSNILDMQTLANILDMQHFEHILGIQKCHIYSITIDSKTYILDNLYFLIHKLGKILFEHFNKFMIHQRPQTLNTQ